MQCCPKSSGHGQLLLVSKITWYNEIYIEAHVYLGWLLTLFVLTPYSFQKIELTYSTTFILIDHKYLEINCHSLYISYINIHLEKNVFKNRFGRIFFWRFIQVKQTFFLYVTISIFEVKRGISKFIILIFHPFIMGYNFFVCITSFCKKESGSKLQRFAYLKLI